jgi:ubiquinone/menaquinone biosynthesis C-methylase UbiE
MLHRRHGGDAARQREVLAQLYPLRDRVLSRLDIGEGTVLLDVGCGDGLIGFGALAAAPSTNVIFSDVSQDLLDHTAAVAREMDLLDRCRFVRASADDLSSIEPASVDAVAARAVLVYVADKARAFTEFHRVLKPRGCLSIFEPIKRFGEPQPAHQFWGYDVTPIMAIAAKVKAVYRRVQPLDADPMMNFDERNLIACATGAGFRHVHLDFQVDIKPLGDLPRWHMTWETFFRSAGNPKVPTLEEAVAQALTPDESRTFQDYMRRLVETKSGNYIAAAAHLSARK